MSNARLRHDFLVFQPMSHAADTHAGTTIDKTKSIKNVCSITIFLYDEFNHSMLMK
jgi:hypothetical protein